MKTFCRECGQVHILTQEQFDAFELCHPCGNQKNLELVPGTEVGTDVSPDMEVVIPAFTIISGA